MVDYHLAAVNIARLKYPIDDSRMAEFVDNLDPINKLGDESPGAIWRFQTEEGDATSERVFDDENILINLTVWESADALHGYTYKSDHTAFVRRRREWFLPLGELPVVTLWWIPAGTLPTPHDARIKSEYLRDHGPTTEAFTFRDRFDPPS